MADAGPFRLSDTGTAWLVCRGTSERESYGPKMNSRSRWCARHRARFVTLLWDRQKDRRALGWGSQPATRDHCPDRDNLARLLQRGPCQTVSSAKSTSAREPTPSTRKRRAARYKLPSTPVRGCIHLEKLGNFSGKRCASKWRQMFLHWTIHLLTLSLRR